jgi:phosphoglycolate phosphatase
MNVLFDLDGTLTDPAEGFVACVSYALEQLACPRRADDDIRRHIGPPLQETLGLLLDDRSRIPDALTLYRERYGAEGLFRCTVYPGIAETLAALRSRGMTLMVATSKPTLYARRILDHHGMAKYFDAVYGSELDGTRSGKIDLLGHLLKSESIDDAVMVGDRAQDIVAARAHGLRSIGVLWGYGSREELVAAGAAALCARPGELPALVA